MHPPLDVRSPLVMSVLGILFVGMVSVAWVSGVYMSPHKTYDDMLANNLSTSYVTKNELSDSNGQASLQQITLQLGKDNLVRSLVTIRSSNANVSTESIGQKGTAYLRYVAISDQTKKRDYRKVTNVWATSKGDTTSSSLSKLFNQSLLDVTAAPVPPLGYVAPEARSNLLEYMRDEGVFTANYTKVKTETINGRKVFTYPVSVKLAPYLRLMQEFSHVYGLKDLDNVSPSAYQSAAPVKLTISVDKLSHQMVRVTMPSSGFNETYTDYGVPRNLSVPTKTISTSELRQRLSSVQ